ncbi:MAG TPA: prepilin peptidase [Syntrophomonadaceae bacterium]|nr:prepilin peptidase [Syntrophomonadaceae bacterium]
MFLNIILAGLVLLAVAMDLKERRIPNWLIVTGIVTALLYRVIMGDYIGCLSGIKGLMVGIMLLFIPFLMGGMGAGDVKLLGMIGAFKGSLFVFNCFIWMALIGGVIALALLIKRRRLYDFISRLSRGLFLSRCGAMKLSDSLDKQELSIYYPYGLAIGLGVLATFIRGWC